MLTVSPPGPLGFWGQDAVNVTRGRRRLLRRRDGVARLVFLPDPHVGAFVAAIVALLGGDADTLQILPTVLDTTRTREPF